MTVFKACRCTIYPIYRLNPLSRSAPLNPHWTNVVFESVNQSLSSGFSSLRESVSVSTKTLVRYCLIADTNSKRPITYQRSVSDIDDCAPCRFHQNFKVHLLLVVWLQKYIQFAFEKPFSACFDNNFVGNINIFSFLILGIRKTHKGVKVMQSNKFIVYLELRSNSSTEMEL